VIGDGLLSSLPSTVLARLELAGVLGMIFILGTPVSKGGIRVIGSNAGGLIGAEKDLEGRVRGCEFSASEVRA
jgi:hypothetical protein